MSAAPVPDDAMEIDTLCEEQIDRLFVEAFFDTAGEFYDHYTDEVLDRDATFGVFEWKRRTEKPAAEKIISTKMFHKAKGDEVRSRIVAREFADGVFALERHAGTPSTWALKLVISRMVSKSRTRQLESHDVSVAFFHAEAPEGAQAE